jgi:hypothetical protein
VRPTDIGNKYSEGKMRQLVVGVAAAIISVVAIACADAKPVFVATAKAADDIRRGQEDAMRCALGYMGPAQITNCSYAMARVNAQDGSDGRAYNAGLTFETWRDLDVDFAADQKPQKPGQVNTTQLRDEETATRTMYLLYRSASDAIGISDKQLLALLSRMTPQGKATTWTRLQFWAKRTR